ncbi:hypothetical protein RFI_15476 [Reticulomyxa filosa]|uniref:Uncharacterized protein n=1 Tax=Reticulomyxa filosa TaxID=46433 RepID=X6N734_RETFI|nr:hypothetical protein RFI_15476 [Reticulomyxa filosa]|eukprot:ETO21728.1 hypothetical protein RFI_15476 [Reticulomyxa filosa]
MPNLRNVVYYTWITLQLVGFGYFACLFNFSGDIADGSNRFRPVWWGFLMIVYGIVSFWVLYKTTELKHMALCVTTGAVINEVFTQICTNNFHNAKPLKVFTWFEFLVLVRFTVFLVELIHWRKDIIVHRSDGEETRAISPKTYQNDNATTLITDHGSSNPFVTPNDDLCPQKYVIVEDAIVFLTERFPLSYVATHFNAYRFVLSYVKVFNQKAPKHSCSDSSILDINSKNVMKIMFNSNRLNKRFIKLE